MFKRIIRFDGVLINKIFLNFAICFEVIMSRVLWELADLKKMEYNGEDFISR